MANCIKKARLSNIFFILISIVDHWKGWYNLFTSTSKCVCCGGCCCCHMSTNLYTTTTYLWCKFSDKKFWLFFHQIFSGYSSLNIYSYVIYYYYNQFIRIIRMFQIELWINRDKKWVTVSHFDFAQLFMLLWFEIIIIFIIFTIFIHYVSMYQCMIAVENGNWFQMIQFNHHHSGFWIFFLYSRSILYIWYNHHPESIVHCQW